MIFKGPLIFFKNQHILEYAGKYPAAITGFRLSSVSLGVTPMISAMKQFNPEVRLRLIQDSSLRSEQFSNETL